MSIAVRSLTGASVGMVARFGPGVCGWVPGGAIFTIVSVDQDEMADETRIELGVWGALSDNEASIAIRGEMRDSSIETFAPMRPPFPDAATLAKDVDRVASEVVLWPRASLVPSVDTRPTMDAGSPRYASGAWPERPES